MDDTTMDDTTMDDTTMGGTTSDRTTATDGVVPDDSDWTWVLERICPDCGFDAAHFVAGDAGDAIRRNAAAWTVVLDRDEAELVDRRRADRWSDLEYAAHVRDVHRLYLTRLQMMLDDHDPLYPNWDQDATAISDDYRNQRPDAVCVELNAAAMALADEFDLVTADQWRRPGRRSDGATFTVDSFARYLVHDPVHHLWDVTGRSAGEQAAIR